MLRHGAVLAWLLVLVGACSVDGGYDGSVAASYDTVGTIPRLTSRGTPDRWTLTLLARIGSVSDTLTSFGRVRSVVLDERHNVYVADVVSRRIAVFDSTGIFVRAIGRRGAGPGEFEQPYALGWLGDTLFVLDWRNARIGKFSKAGEWLGMMRWQPVTGEEIRLVNGSASDLYVPFMDVPLRALAYQHLTPIGVADTMQWPDRPAETPSGPICQYPDGGIEFFGIPFGPQLLVTGGPDGMLYAGWSADYQIATTTAAADTMQLIARIWPHVPIGDAEWQERTARYRTVQQDNPGTTCDPDEQPRPAHKPAYRWIGVAADGRLWVEAYVDHGFAFDVFASRGALIASAPAPERDTQVPPYVGRDRLAIVTRDSLDVQYVEVYAIHRR